MRCFMGVVVRFWCARWLPRARCHKLRIRANSVRNPVEVEHHLSLGAVLGVVNSLRGRKAAIW